MHRSIDIHGGNQQEGQNWGIPSIATQAVAKLLNYVPRVWTTEEPFQKEKENVWIHTTETIALIKEYANLIKKYWWDMAHIINLLIVHDIPEILTGDMDPRLIDPNTKFYLEEWAMTNLISNPNDRDLWYEYAFGETIDSKFAKVFDKLQFLNNLIRLWEETEYWNAMKKYRVHFEPFPELLQIVDKPTFLVSEKKIQKVA